MEALSLERLDERMKNLDARTRSNHNSITKLHEGKEGQGRVLVRIEQQLEDQAEDISEMKATMKWIVRGLFGAIAVGLMFVVGVGSLILQIATG